MARAVTTHLGNPTCAIPARILFKFDNSIPSKSTRRMRPHDRSIATTTAKEEPTLNPTTATVFVASKSCSSALIRNRLRFVRTSTNPASPSVRTRTPLHG